jgi:cytochrome c553
MATIEIAAGIRPPRPDGRTRKLSRLLGCMLSVLASNAAFPATPAGKTGAADELRPAYATSRDVAEGKQVADGLCAKCHGTSGVSATKGVPHLAGQRSSYLYAKVKAYQAGTRDEHVMESAVKFLNEDALVKVAAYYATLEPASPAAEPAAKGSAPVDALAAAKAAAAPCIGCHGETGVSKIPGTPNLTGLDPKYFVAAMNAYKGGQRKHDLMKSFATALNDADTKGVALYFALQKAAPAQTPSTGDVAAGKAAATVCAGCHGEQGVSTNPANPSLAGQDAQYAAGAIRAYKDGTRAEETMKLAASALGDKAIADIAAYYATQPPRQPKVDKPLALSEWVQRCDRCHGINGNSIDPRTPALAGQRVEYLQKALEAYQGGQRRNSVMAAMSGSLTDADVAGLAAHYARQKPRAFVFVMVPAK